MHVWLEFGSPNNQTQRKFSVSSYYPNHGNDTHILAYLDTAHDSDPNDDNIENEDDWMEDHIVDTCRVSAKTSKVMATEVSP